MESAGKAGEKVNCDEKYPDGFDSDASLGYKLIRLFWKLMQTCGLF